MKLDLATVDAKDRDRIGPRLLGMLVRSPWRRPAHWSRACVVHHPGRVEVVPRAQVVEELRAAGALEAAHEASVRKVGPGCVLVWLVADDEAMAIAGLLVVDLLGGRK
jgi:hypothetical protein